MLTEDLECREGHSLRGDARAGGLPHFPLFTKIPEPGVSGVEKLRLEKVNPGLRSYSSSCKAALSPW
jgi:hypothetical protein